MERRRGFTALLAAVGAAGVLLLAWGAWRTPWPMALAIVGAATVADLAPIRIREELRISLISVVGFVGILLGGAGAAALCAAGTLVSIPLQVRDRKIIRTIYNVGQMAVAAAVGGATYTLIAGGYGELAVLGSGRSIAALPVTAAVFIGTNYGLVVAAIHLTSGEPVRSVVGSMRIPHVISIALLDIGLAALGAAAALALHPLVLLTLVVPAAVARHALMGYQAEAEAYDRLVSAFVKIIEVKDAYTRGHAVRTAELAVEVARELGFDYEQRRQMRYAALLHDIGKVRMRGEVLTKPGALDPEEWAHMRDHPLAGVEVISGIDFLRPVTEAVRYHHERLDGSGYPERRAGDDITLTARIIAVVDAYDAMTTERPYQPARTPEQALLELRRCAGSQFDPQVVDALERVLARAPAPAAATAEPATPPAAAGPSTLPTTAAPPAAATGATSPATTPPAAGTPTAGRPDPTTEGSPGGGPDPTAPQETTP